MFQSLVAYKSKHGHTAMPKNWVDPILRNWVLRQRKEYKKSILSTYRKQRLDSIGFRWSFFVPWMVMYQQLCSYKREHAGSTRVDVSPIEFKQLKKWVQRQRGNNAVGKLSEVRKYLLESIGFEWKVRISIC